MTAALVGYTGFVGSNLAAQWRFDHLYNSSNVADLAGREFDTVVFSAAKAEKWRINQDPEADRHHIEQLERILAGFTAGRLVLVSTVDVYGHPEYVDESTDIDTAALHPYGAHRLRLEEFARSQHPSTTVVRLPGLFGPGLKKNVIFDLLHDNNVDRINPAGSFQYYDLRTLGRDLDKVVELDIPLVNLVTEPVRTDQVAARAFGLTLPPSTATAGRYDVRSLYADLLGGSSGYLQTREQVLHALTDFVQGQASR